MGVYKAWKASRREVKANEKAFEKDDRRLMLTGYHGEDRTVGQLESFQTVGFNMKQLLDGTNTDRFEIRLATQEDIDYFNSLDEE